MCSQMWKKYIATRVRFLHYVGINRKEVYGTQAVLGVGAPNQRSSQGFGMLQIYRFTQCYDMFKF